MKKTIVLFVVALAVVSCGDDDGEADPVTTEDGSAIVTPPNFPVVFPDGGTVATVDNSDGASPIESVVVIYPDGDLDELAQAIRKQLPPDTEETPGQGQISMVSAQVIVNLSQTPDGVWISVSAL